MRDASHDIEIHYTRPPGHVTVFRQQLVHRTNECIVTLLDHADVRRPVMVRGVPVLERGAPIVWFTFPGAWHDIGRFHSVTGQFTGFYANVLTPVRFSTPTMWETTDLFLDVWMDDNGTALLDEDELAMALQQGVIPADDAGRARAEADALLAAAAAGTWPPPVCREWTLERARAASAGRDRSPGSAVDGTPAMDGTPGGAAV